MTRTEPALRRLLLIGEEPILQDLLRGHLNEMFDVSGEPSNHAGALASARLAEVDVVLVDADLKETDPAELVAGLALVCAAPVVVLSAAAGPGSPAAAALFLAGAHTVLHKPAGRLPLDLGGDFGDTLLTILQQAAGP
jgi:DNA-binding NarL/FixJ family response regulator